jgi:hypothetical protein
MTFRETLERFGLDVEELLNTEVGDYKSGQTFSVNGHIVSEGAGDPGQIQLWITALKWEEAEDAPKLKRTRKVRR